MFEGRPVKADWWQGAVIYQIYPRSYQDSSGNGIGDLKGIYNRLDYIADLGVDAIWISPFYKSPMRDFGYDISDFYDVDPLFGDLNDFDAIVEKCHALNIKVIIDQVYSHTAAEHPWFQESRASRDNEKSDWYVWADAKDDGSPPNNWQSVFTGSAWAWDARRKQYYLHNFLTLQPDLNLRHPAVQEAILGVARFWLDRGVDGFRLDATNFYMHDPSLKDNPAAIPPKGPRPYDHQQHLYNRSHPDIFPFLKRIRDVLNEYDARFSVAEIGDRNSEFETLEYCNSAERLHTAYSFVFIENQSLSAEFIRQSIENWENMSNGAWPSWTFSNHDSVRAPSRWGNANDPRFAKLLNALLLSLKGTIFLYQGEELGLPQANIRFEDLQDPEAILNWPDTLGRDGGRTPIPWSKEETNGGFSTHKTWLPMDERHLDLDVESQQQDRGSTYHATKKFLTLRKKHTALTVGDVQFIDAPEPIIAFTRQSANERLTCVFNLSSTPVKWHPPMSGMSEVLLCLNSDTESADTAYLNGYEARIIKTA